MAAPGLVNLFWPDGRRQVLRLCAPAPLAGGCALPWMRQPCGGPGRMRRHAALSATASVQGLRVPFRRPHRHRAGRAPPAAAGVGAVPLFHGPEPFQPTDRPGVGPGCFGRAGHDGAAAPRAGRQNAGGGADGRSRARRGLRGGRAQGPAGRSGQKGRLGRCRRLAGVPGRGTLEKDKPPLYLGFFQFVHNARRRGKALLGALVR